MSLEPTRKAKTEILQSLIRDGWVPLRQAAILLNYGELRGIYAKQRSREPIPVIKVGGTYRVYVDALFDHMASSPKVEPAEYEALKHLYEVGHKEYLKAQKKLSDEDEGDEYA